MVAYGWKYVFRDFSSETFAERESALRDLVARFPATAPFAEYLLFLEPTGERVMGLVAADAAEGTSSFSVRV
jgi:hypothetical protein